MLRLQKSCALNAVSFTKVALEDNFWACRLQINQKYTVPAIYRKCKETGRIDAFLLHNSSGTGLKVHPFWDSDVAKWIESTSYSLAVHPDPELESLINDVIDKIASVQQEDGYLNTYYTVAEPEYRWRKLAFGHELYCAGHLIEAAVAHYQTTGKTKFLDVIRRYADYIDSVFGSGKRNGYPGHPEIELALVKLYRLTGEKRYLNLSKFFLDRRGQSPSVFKSEMGNLPFEHSKFYRRLFNTGENFNTQYCQDHLPVREQVEVVGHAVRAMYLYSGMADVAVETEDDELFAACKRLWKDITKKRMYVTGGIGSSADNEGFTHPYDLPNRSAYAETCAAISLVFFAHRMLQLDPDSRYADVMERALYNGVISGVSLDGKKFFYDNPLESWGDHHRQEWFDCACCPPNIARLIASVGGYVYSQTESDAYVHLYVQGTGELRLGDQKVLLRQKTDYPWDGRIKILVEPERTTVFGLNLRIPGWSRKVEILVNGGNIDVNANSKKGYSRIEREWKSGDTVEVAFPMPIERIVANPAVRENIGHVALQRGPIIYCLEKVDHDVPLHQIVLPTEADLKVKFDEELLGGVAVITGEAKTLDASDWHDELYRNTAIKMKPCKITAVPYYTWDNRSPGEMRVWIRSL